MDRSISITLFRHGMTTENERSAYIGWTDSPLTKKGTDQLWQIKDQLDMEIDAVFTSDLMRCVTTAAIYFPHIEAKKMIDLRELHFGNWEGKTYDELKHIKSYEHWLAKPFEANIDDGENFKQFSRRLDRAFEMMRDEILKKSLYDIAIVVHGGVIRYFLTKLTKSSNDFFMWKTPYGRGYRLEWNADSFRRGDRCTSLQEVPSTERENG